jgi:hypothetical protein
MAPSDRQRHDRYIEFADELIRRVLGRKPPTRLTATSPADPSRKECEYRVPAINGCRLSSRRPSYFPARAGGSMTKLLPSKLALRMEFPGSKPEDRSDPKGRDRLRTRRSACGLLAFLSRQPASSALKGAHSETVMEGPMAGVKSALDHQPSLSALAGALRTILLVGVGIARSIGLAEGWQRGAAIRHHDELVRFEHIFCARAKQFPET